MIPVSAYIVFSRDILYPTYEYAPRLIAGFTPADDQLLAGIIMKSAGMAVSLDRARGLLLQMVEVLASRALTARERLSRLLADPPAAAVLAACAVILGLRRAEALTNPQFWAEDAYFFERAYVFGWRAFLEPFAGYLHTVLRMIAQAAVADRPLPRPGDLRGVLGRRPRSMSRPGRCLRRCPLPRFAGACALAVVLVPDTYEVFLNVVNLQWVLAAGLILLLSRATRRARASGSTTSPPRRSWA